MSVCPSFCLFVYRTNKKRLNPCDFKFRRHWAPGLVLPKPTPYGKIPGEDLSGVVVALGPPARGTAWPQRRFRVGDRVAAMLPLLGTRWGSYAEFAAVRLFTSLACFVPKIVACLLASKSCRVGSFHFSLSWLASARFLAAIHGAPDLPSVFGW